jgi:hypothetical protein
MPLSGEIRRRQSVTDEFLYSCFYGFVAHSFMTGSAWCHRLRVGTWPACGRISPYNNHTTEHCSLLGVPPYLFTRHQCHGLQRVTVGAKQTVSVTMNRRGHKPCCGFLSASSVIPSIHPIVRCNINTLSFHHHNNNNNNTTPLGLSSRLAAAPQGRLPHSTLRTGAGEVGAADLLAGETTKRTAPTRRLDISRHLDPRASSLWAFRCRTVAIASHRVPNAHSVREEGSSAARPCF